MSDTEEILQQNGSKRLRGPTGGAGGGGVSAASASTAGLSCTRLPNRVGSGVYEQDTLSAVVQAVGELALEVQDVKAAVVKSLVGPVDWVYTEEALRWRQLYGQQCNSARGTGRKVGHVKNYVLAGLVYAARRNGDITEQEKKRLEELVSAKIKGPDGKLDLGLIPELAARSTRAGRRPMSTS